MNNLLENTYRSTTVSTLTCYKLIAGVCAATCLLTSTPALSNQVIVDVSKYMTQASAGQTLCISNFSECVHQYPNQYGEYAIFYEDAGKPVVVDYIARSTSPSGANGGYYIGVTRSYDNNTSNGPRLRCFSNPNTNCTAPPSTSSMPEGIPKNLLLNVVLPGDDYAASAADKTPISQIAGSVSITGLNYFQVNTMDFNTCSQSSVGIVPVNVFAAFLYQYPFGGDVGTQNALVVEEVEYQNLNGQIVPNHIERYYYVPNYGRVRDSTAVYVPSTQRYSDYVGNTKVGNDALRNTLRAVNQMPAEPTNYCPQGTNSLSN